MRRLACALAAAFCLPLAPAHAAPAEAGRVGSLRLHDAAKSPARSFAAAARQQQDARQKPPPEPARRDGADKDEGDETQQPKLDAERPAAAARQNAGKTVDQLVAEALAESIRGSLRAPKVGETRARGVLLRIECAQRGIIFHLKAGRRALRLHAASFDGLHIMAYNTREAGDEITCGERTPESHVVVTYRAKADAKSKTDGSLSAVEFVPADFQLKP